MKPTEKMLMLKASPLWPIVETAIDDLIENQDIELTTMKDCVVSYIVKKILEK